MPNPIPDKSCGKHRRQRGKTLLYWKHSGTRRRLPVVEREWYGLMRVSGGGDIPSHKPPERDGSRSPSDVIERCHSSIYPPLSLDGSIARAIYLCMCEHGESCSWQSPSNSQLCKTCRRLCKESIQHSCFIFWATQGSTLSDSPEEWDIIPTT